VEQVALVLQRAGSAPLQLEVSLPAEESKLKYVSAQNLPIRSLAFKMEYDTFLPFIVSEFRDFNFSEVQKLDLRDLSWEVSKGIADFALQCKCTSMTLDLSYDAFTLDFFRHDLLQRTSNIGLELCQLIFSSPSYNKTDTNSQRLRGRTFQICLN
jgi:hypothetical protein